MELTCKADLSSNKAFVVLPFEERHSWICLFLRREMSFRAKKVVKLLCDPKAPSLKLVKLHTRIGDVTGVHENLHKLSSEVKCDFLLGETQSFKLFHHGEVLRIISC